MRLFVAITLDETIKENLIPIQESIKKYQPHAKLVERENIHLTLRFLGEIAEATLPQVFEALSVAHDYESFEMELKNIGAFPSAKKPRIIWIGCEDNDSVLNKLYQSIESGLRAIGLPPDDKAFSAHITLARDSRPSRFSGIRVTTTGSNNTARNKAPQSNYNFEALLKKYPSNPVGTQTVRQITLFQSTLTSDGPIYTNIRDFKLK
jgi:RNA 2',3'-cyclic 3'-phosphodiesterase